MLGRVRAGLAEHWLAVAGRVETPHSVSEGLAPKTVLVREQMLALAEFQVDKIVAVRGRWRARPDRGNERTAHSSSLPTRGDRLTLQLLATPSRRRVGLGGFARRRSGGPSGAGRRPRVFAAAAP